MSISKDIQEKIISLIKNTTMTYTDILNEMLEEGIYITYEEFIDFLRDYQFENGYILRLYTPISDEQNELIKTYMTNEKIEELYRQGFTLKQIMKYFEDLGIQKRNLIIEPVCRFMVDELKRRDKLEAERQEVKVAFFYNGFAKRNRKNGVQTGRNIHTGDEALTKIKIEPIDGAVTMNDIKDEFLRLVLSTTTMSYGKIVSQLAPDSNIRDEDISKFLKEYQQEHGYLIRGYYKIPENQRALIEKNLTRENIIELHEKGYSLKEIYLPKNESKKNDRKAIENKMHQKMIFSFL